MELNKKTKETCIGEVEKNYLFQLFEADIAELERMLGWDCSDWKISRKNLPDTHKNR